MKLLLLIIAFAPIVSVYSQKIMPGGVQGARIWEVTEFISQVQGRWKSKTGNHSDSGFIAKGNIKTINYNPALLFPNGKNPVYSTLDLGKLAAFSLFTVCQEKDTLNEWEILSIETDTVAEMVLTSRRIAALDTYRYANYKMNLKTSPKIYSYTQNKTSDPATASRRLQFGSSPHPQHLPVSGFNGIIPEVILFSRYISPIERQKVESYLAIKYGISLNQEFPVSYLNSTGEIIWDAEINSTYCENIAGIGRDDLTALNQRISESTQTPGVMKIGVTGELNNNSFVIWGDNGKPFRFVEEPGLRKLEREWKICSHNFKGENLYFSSDELSFNEINPLRTGETYWMMIDRSGTGKFPFSTTEFVQCMPSLLTEKTVQFNSISIDPDFSGSDVFTLLAAPQLFARSTIKSPKCNSTQSGEIQLEIAGGMPPFEIILKGSSISSLQTVSKEYGRDHIFGDISQGSYEFQVTDADNNKYFEKIWVSNSTLWESRIIQDYKLKEGEKLIINASDGMPAVDFFYTWTLPGGSHVYDEVVSIEQPGNYLLSVTDNNSCNSTHEIRVIQTGKSNFRNVQLFPNPVKGWFALRMDLERKMDVNVVISDITGRVLKQTVFKNDLYYQYNDIIQLPGIYYITLVSDYETETLKLIVQ
jgi:hypothetical protein